jgi:WD40 repeat protein/serine/threonine protein kinase
MPGQRSIPFLDHLRESQLLDPAQLEEVSGYPEAQDPDPRKLARRLLDRGWLTRFQINQVAQGRTKDLVIGSYVVLDRLGEGGMGQVYKARHQHMNRVVALKVIRKEKLSHPDAVRRFYKEIQAAAQLSHPNIVLAFDAGQTGQTHFFAMEYIDGTDLSQLVKEMGPLPVGKACDYIRQAALGLQHAHERGLVHRDIKPHNLLVVTGGGTSTSQSGSPGKDVVKILDMGLARLQGPAENENAVTKDGVVIGTPDFLAPEQATNARSADIRSDLYSLGCTFYYLLTGQAPFQGASLTEVLLHHQLNQARPVDEVRPEVPPAVAAIIARLMAKNPAERFQTPTELADALAPFCPGTSGTVVAAAAAVPAPNPNPAPVGFVWDTLGGEKASETPVPAFAGSHTEPLEEDLPRAVSKKNRPESPQAATKRRLMIGIGGAFHLAGLIILIVWLATRNSSKPDPEPEPRNSVVMVTTPKSGSQPSTKPKVKNPDQPGDPLRQPVPPADPLELARMSEIAGPPKLLASQLDKGAQCVLFTPDGQRILIGDGAGNIRLLNLADGKEIYRVGGPELKRIIGLAFTADGRRFLSASLDHTLRLWETETGAALQPIIKSPEGFSSAMALSPDGRYAIESSIGTAARTWDTTSGTEIGERRLPHPGKARTLAFSVDGRLVVSGDSQGKVWLWNAATAKEMAHFEGHPNSTVTQVALAAKGGLVVSFSSGDHTLRGWDVANRAERWKVGADGSRVAFAADGLSVLAAAADQTLKWWDLQTGLELRSFPLDRPKMQRLWAIAPDGRSFLSGGSDGIWWWTFRQTATPGRNDTPPLEVAQKGIRQLAFAPDGRLLAWGMDNRLGIYDRTTRIFRHRFQGQPDATQAVFLPGGRTVLTAGGTRVSLWDVETGAEVRRFEERRGAGAAGIVCLACSADGRQALTAGSDQIIDLWDVQTGKLVRRFNLGDSSANCLTFTPDGQQALVGCADATMRVWNLATDAKLKVVLPGKGGVFALAFAPDGGQLLSANGDLRLYLWDPANWKQVRSFTGHGGIVRAVAFSPDGQQILSGGDDKTVRLWDRNTGRELRLVHLQNGGVTCLAFAADGRLMASGGQGGSILLKDLVGNVAVRPPKLDPEVSKPPLAKQPVPEVAKQEEAAKEIRNLYKNDFAKKANADRAALAEKLIGTARDTKDKPVEKFVLLREARDLASQAGDLKLAWKAIGELANSYVIDPFAMKVELLGKQAEAATTVTTAKPVLEQYFTLSDEALARDDYEEAGRLLALADAIARKVNNPLLINLVEPRTKSVRELKEAFETVKMHAATLKTKPKDPEASLAVGKFYCFVKGDWEKGLPLLAAGSDAPLKAAAQKELANPDQPAGQIEVGDAWWELAKTAEAPAKLPLQRRACYWYEVGVAGTTGLTRTQTENRIKELEAAPGFKPLEPVGLVRVLEGSTEPIRGVALSKDGRLALSCGGDQGLCLWNVRSGKEIRRFGGRELLAVALAPDGQKAATCSADGTVSLWDLETGQARTLMSSIRDNPAESVAFLPTGKQLVYATFGRNVTVQSLEPGSPTRSYSSGRWGTIKSLAVSPNGRFVVIGSQEGTVFVCDLEANGQITLLNGHHNAAVLAVAFAPDGRYMLSAGADGNVALWDGLTGKRLKNHKHVAAVTSVAFSPDGTRFVTGCADKTVRLWDAKRGVELKVFRDHTGEVTSVAFASDGVHVLSASVDKTLRWWRVPK